MSANQTIDYRNVYGTVETQGLVNGPEFHDQYADARTVPWTQPGLTVTRLRLLSDPGLLWWDVSYCYGELSSGEKVRVQLPFSDLPKRGLYSAIVAAAIKDRVHAKKMGVLSAISKLC